MQNSEPQTLQRDKSMKIWLFCT